MNKKKNKHKKGKTFHKKEKKKVQTFSCIKFTLLLKFENSMSMCHTDYFIFMYGC